MSLGLASQQQNVRLNVEIAGRCRTREASLDPSGPQGCSARCGAAHATSRGASCRPWFQGWFELSANLPAELRSA